VQRLLNDGSLLRSLSGIVGLGEMVVGDGRLSCLKYHNHCMLIPAQYVHHHDGEDVLVKQSERKAACFALQKRVVLEGASKMSLN